MNISRCLHINHMLRGGRDESRWMLLPRRPMISRSRYGYGPALSETCMKDWESSSRGGSASMGQQVGLLSS